MLRILSFALVVAGLSVSVSAKQPIEVYGKDPEVSDVEISPDGTKVAMIRNENDRAGLMVLELATKKAMQYDLGEIKVRDVEWNSDNHVLFYATETTNNLAFRSTLIEFCGVFSVDTRGKNNPKQLLSGNGDKLAAQGGLCDITSRLWTDTGDVLMGATTDVKGIPGGQRDLYRVNGKSGRGGIITRGTAATSDWITSPQGYVIARVDYSSKSDRYRVFVPTDEDKLGGYKAIFEDETKTPEMSIYGANTAGTALIVGTRSKTDRFSLFEMSLTDGSIGKALFEPPSGDISGVIKDPYSGAIVGANYAHDYTEQIFFENDLQAVLLGTSKALPNWGDVTLLSWDRNRQKFVLFASGGGATGDYFVFDRTKGKLEHLTRARPDLAKGDIGIVTAFTFKARDGLVIPAYLTLPSGVSEAQAKNMPLVMLPHGGPASRDDGGFDYWAQAIASRGYAVLQVNFRGSNGYGTAFEEAGHGEWGGKMQDDVTDGVKNLIERGIADPQRICIVGGSYGGYAALAGVAFTPDLYKCAISVNGVSHLVRKMNWVANRYGTRSPSYEYWQKSMGSDADSWLAHSPAAAAQNIKAPVLLIHGKDDTVVAHEQSELMEDALKAAGKPVQFVTLDGEDHWLSKSKTRIAMLKLMDGFLVQHLGQPTTASAN